MNMLSSKHSGFSILITLLSLVCAQLCQGAKVPDGIAVFSVNIPKVYLDLSNTSGVDQAVDDLQRCFREMTGVALPTNPQPRFFDPTSTDPLRVQCRIARIIDDSNNAGDNATVSLLLSPVTSFTGGPFSVTGEKISLDCTWHKIRKQLELRLVIAKDAYYGPGYGPYTFKRLLVEGVDLSSKTNLQLSLEMRSSNGDDIRGGYSLDGTNWTYTEWFDPLKAGIDNSVPGESDKNGVQAWSSDWQSKWKDKTAAFVTGYAPTGRVTKIWVNDFIISQAGKILLNNNFSESKQQKELSITPSQGTVSFDSLGALLEPQQKGYYTVGIRADHSVNTKTLLPIMLKQKTMPNGATLLDTDIQQGYEIIVSKKQIVLQAYTKLGLQNAIYTMLDRWGCKWIMPGKIGEVIPKHKSLSLAIGTIRNATGYDNGPDGSGSWSGDKDILTWYDRNAGGRNHSQSSNHYWHYAIPPAKYFKDHPEWFALIGGKRVPSQLCTSNPEVIAKMIEVAKAYLKSQPSAVSFPMDPEDTMDFCQCDNCRAQDPQGRGSDGLPLVTDRVITFCNAVADGIKEEFPDRYIGVLAYSNHLMPPVRVKPAKNIIITICRSNSCNLHLLPIVGCPTAKRFYDIVQGWSKVTKNINVYEYDPISWIGSLPCPTYLDHGIALSLLFRKYDVKGGVVDRVPYTMERSPTTYINYYMERRMKTDPNRNPDVELVNMCTAFFGPAGKWMNMYYRELSAATKSLHPGRDTVGMGLYRYDEFFNKQMITSARSYMNKALTASDQNPQYKERVQFMDLGQQYLEAYLDGVWSAQNKDYTRCEAAFDRADTIIDKLAAMNAIDAPDAHWRMHCAHMKTLAEHFADKMGFVRTWTLSGPFDNDKMDADFQTDDIVLSTADKSKWVEYTSPEGMLNFENAFKGASKSWRLSSAYAAVNVVAPRAVQVQFRMDSFFAFRIYVNGTEVFHRPGLNADCPDRQMTQVNLNAGENRIVFKSSQTCISTDSFPWGIFFRMTDSLGNPIQYSSTSNGKLVIDETKLPAVLVTFPPKWQFAKEGENMGTAAGWQNAGFDDSKWQAIPVPDVWDNTIGSYVGYAWYRTRFTLPADINSKSLKLIFEGVDEEAWVYLNGELIGERSLKSTGKTADQIWELPFTFQITNAIYGGENTLAIRVGNSGYAGGIYRPVSLVATE